MPNRLPLVFILITMVIDSMGIGLILPVMPDLLQDVGGGDLAQAAIWGGVLSTAFAVMQFLFGPVVGNVSDRFGRRPVLLVALFVMATDYIVMAVAGSIWILLIGRVVGGITAATQSTAAAYIADISAAEEKSRRFGLIGAAFGIGFVLGPVVGGLLSEFGTRAPFYAAAALTAASFLFGLLVLPETVTDRIRRPLSWARANPFGAFRHVGQLPGIAPLMAIFLIYQIAFYVYPAVWAYYTQERFGWDARMIGLSLAAFGISMALVQGGLIGVFLKRFGDRGTLVFGFVFNVFAFIAIAAVNSGTLLLLLTPLTALGAVVNPAIQGITSRIVPDNAQGELQGVLTSLSALAMILAPVLMTQTFARFTAADAPFYLPAAPFYLSALLMVLVAGVYILSARTAATAN